MTAKDKRNPMISLGVSTAMAAVMLSGCAGNPAPRAEVSAAQAQQAMQVGNHDGAIQAAEAAVLAEPRNAGYRMTLGNAYLDAGRFGSAATSFEDAMALGDNSPRAALSLALALTGQARFAEAAALLNDWEGEIAASDLGLAFALSGQPERGIHILSNAIRGGDNTVKTRQNLAYAYAVAGRWRESRMMVAQDVPAHEVGQRMTEWAQMTHAEAYQQRVASLLGVPAGVADGGQPVQLALANSTGVEQLASEASGYAANSGTELAALDPVPAPPRMTIPATGSELPRVGGGAPEVGLDTYRAPRSDAPANFAEAFATEAPAGGSLAAATAETMRFVSQPVVQSAPVREGATPRAAGRNAETPRPTARRETSVENSPVTAALNAEPVDGATHLVQLGSFSSEQGARRAWGIYVSRYPELANRDMVITEAVVNGRNYWRVSAGGYDLASSRAMCGRVNSSNGDGCISWAANSPLPGAIDNGVRLARR